MHITFTHFPRYFWLLKCAKCYIGFGCVCVCVLTEVENWMGRGSSLHHIGEQKTCPEGFAPNEVGENEHRGKFSLF